MHRRKMSARRGTSISVAVLLVVTTAAVLEPAAAKAADEDLPSTLAISGSYNGSESSRFQSPANPLAGKYVLQSDYWNKAVAGAAIPNVPVNAAQVCSPGTFNLNFDQNRTAFSVTGNTANSYFPNKDEPGCGNRQTDQGGQHHPCAVVAASTPNPFEDWPVDNQCQWAGHGDPYLNPNMHSDDAFGFNAVQPSWIPTQDMPLAAQPQKHIVGLNSEYSNQIHAPASYPSIFLGCHWSKCSPGAGAPLPMRMSGMVALPVDWSINTSAARQSGATWDASLDIWLDTNSRPGNFLPGSPAALGSTTANPGQNDGAEVMVWANNSGYNADNPAAGVITPVGVRLQHNIAMGLLGGHWDVWAGRARSFDNGVRWNVISFVNVDRSERINSDIKPFLDFAANLGARCTTSLLGGQAQANGIADETTNCVDPAWFVTSVQAGFEIWNLPSTGRLRTNSFSTSPTALLPYVSDFDGEPGLDIAVWRPAEGNWYQREFNTPTRWGQPGDIPVVGDYIGEGGNDFAIWRPSDGNWWSRAIGHPIQWGIPGDIPVPGDYNGDGTTDIAVWRPSEGNWYIRGSGPPIQWGQAGDIPVPGDYDGDGVTDIAVFRPSEHTWYILGIDTVFWGDPGDVPVPGDYDGDGVTDVAIWRPSDGNWWVSNFGGPIQWGLAGDIPIPGDYDGDGATDIAVWRPSEGNWYRRNASGPPLQWGRAGDIPV